MVACLVSSVGVMSGLVPAAHAIPPIGPDPAVPTPLNSQLVLGPESADVGLAVRGFLGPEGFDPLVGYPPAIPNPPAGFTPAEGGALMFAGTIAATTQSGVQTALYCVDLATATYVDLGYGVTTWSAVGVAHLGFINRIVNTYFPQSGLPAAGTDALRAAAVQAAIWFFSDRFVLSTAINPALYPIVAGIVAQTLAAGPLNAEPPLPEVAIDGPDTITAGMVAGPFTLRTNGAQATLTVGSAGVPAEVFSDAAGTQPLPTTVTLPAGSQFYLRVNTPDPVQLSASAQATALPGTATIYRPANPDAPDPATAQILVLAMSAPLNVSTTRIVTAVNPINALPATGPGLAGTLVAAALLLAAGMSLTALTRIRKRR